MSGRAPIGDLSEVLRIQEEMKKIDERVKNVKCHKHKDRPMVAIHKHLGPVCAECCGYKGP